MKVSLNTSVTRFYRMTISTRHHKCEEVNSKSLMLTSQYLRHNLRILKYLQVAEAHLSGVESPVTFDERTLIIRFSQFPLYRMLVDHFTDLIDSIYMSQV